MKTEMVVQVLPTVLAYLLSPEKCWEGSPLCGLLSPCLVEGMLSGSRLRETEGELMDYENQHGPASAICCLGKISSHVTFRKPQTTQMGQLPTLKELPSQTLAPEEDCLLILYLKTFFLLYKIVFLFNLCV